MSFRQNDEDYTYSQEYQLWWKSKFSYITQKWEFCEWMPTGWHPSHAWQAAVSSNIVGSEYRSQSGFQGTYINGSNNGSHYESLDPSFFVRPSSFFTEGRVFAIIMSEAAGGTAYPSRNNSSYSLHAIRYNDNYVHTQTRRFVVVSQKREFCYACPIYTYSGRATTKPGVRPAEHGIIYSIGQQPRLVHGETGITKTSIGVIMISGERPLHEASRIYYGIHHPVQYNVKVKDIGYVPPSHLPYLIDNWRSEANNAAGRTSHQAEVSAGTDNQVATPYYYQTAYTSGYTQPSTSTYTQQSHAYSGAQDEGDNKEEEDDDEVDEIEAENESGIVANNYRGLRKDESGIVANQYRRLHLERATNPRAFFKKGRVFVIAWQEAGDYTSQSAFAVIKPRSSSSVCLRIFSPADRVSATPQSYVAIISRGISAYERYQAERQSGRRPIEVKIEDPDGFIEPNSVINFTEPQTIAHDVKMHNVGRVVGDSVGQLEELFKQSFASVS